MRGWRLWRRDVGEASDKTNCAEKDAPQDLAELFRRDPLKLTDQDLDRIVGYFRGRRAIFAAQERKPKAESKKARKERVEAFKATIIAEVGMDVFAGGQTVVTEDLESRIKAAGFTVEEVVGKTKKARAKKAVAKVEEPTGFKLMDVGLGKDD